MAGVTQKEGFAARRARLMNRLAALRAGYARPSGGFLAQPEPRSIGAYARGRQLLSGTYLLAGQLVEAPRQSLWEVEAPSPAFAAEAQGFGWLDDLAALGDAAGRDRAQRWTAEWIARYGRGRGPGWEPQLAGRRLIRWVNHAPLLLQGRDEAEVNAWLRATTRQLVFLARRWPKAAPGLPRFEALAGLIHAGLALEGMERHVDPAVTALARDCTDEIDAEGGIASRNPEELLEILTLLLWAEQALQGAGREALPAHRSAIQRIVPVLRALRHADGGLARFHGGGRGAEGKLDRALAGVPVLRGPQLELAMGFARLAAARTTVIVDAAPPPPGLSGHASTLAFELTSGRRPLIVCCGAGAPFGPSWRKAGRATPSHSTLAIEGFSSSRLASGGQETMADRARVLRADRSLSPEGQHLHLAHDGWSATHGLTHRRDLLLAADGRQLSGTDTLAALTGAERKRFEQLMTRGGWAGVRHALRFHLHPDVEAELDMGGSTVSLALKSGEIWLFRPEGGASLTLEPSVYLQRGRLKPRATKQIVLAGVAVDFEDRIGWTLAKAQDTPLAIRDLDREDLPDRP